MTPLIMIAGSTARQQGKIQKLSLVLRRTGVPETGRSERARLAGDDARAAPTAAINAAPARASPSITCRKMCISRQTAQYSPAWSWLCRVKTKTSAETAASVKNAVRTRNTSLLRSVIVMVKNSLAYRKKYGKSAASRTGTPPPCAPAAGCAGKGVYAVRPFLFFHDKNTNRR